MKERSCFHFVCCFVLGSSAFGTAMTRRVRLPEAARVRPVETTVYEVEARLLWLFTETDNDYHIVLASPRGTTITMIAEVPDPECAGACASGFGSTYARVRQELLEYLNSPQSAARPLVRITEGGLFRLPPRPTGRRSKRDRATPRDRRRVPVAPGHGPWCGRREVGLVDPGFRRPCRAPTPISVSGTLGPCSHRGETHTWVELGDHHLVPVSP